MSDFAFSTDPTSASPAAEGRRWLTLYVLCAGMLMIILDGTIVNVALPSIQDDLGFSQPSLAWVVNAYLIPFGGLLLLAGRLGDLISRRTIFLYGIGLFILASAIAGAAGSQEMLIGARFIQGIGGAMASAGILGMIVTMFPEPAEQSKAIGVYAFVASAGASIGLLLGGVLTEAISWHWIFFVNLPIGIVTAILASRLLERDHGMGMEHGADAPGAVLITGSLMLGVYTIVEAANYGWGSARTLVLGAVSLTLLAAFVRREQTTSNPLMPLRILRSRNVSGANLIQVLMVAGLFGMFFLGALYMQRVLGYSAVDVGLAFLPVSVGIGAFSFKVSPALVTRYGGRPVLIGGLTLVAAGLALFTRVPVDANYVTDLMPTMILFGIGAGLAFPALVTLAMSGATESDAGLASGLVNTTQQVGGALGLAVLATLSTARSDTLLAAGSSSADALTSGYRLAFVVGLGFVLAAIAVAVRVLQPEHAAQPAEAESMAFDPARDHEFAFDES